MNIIQIKANFRMLSDHGRIMGINYFEIMLNNTA